MSAALVMERKYKYQGSALQTEPDGNLAPAGIISEEGEAMERTQGVHRGALGYAFAIKIRVLWLRRKAECKEFISSKFML